MCNGFGKSVTVASLMKVVTLTLTTLDAVKNSCCRLVAKLYMTLYDPMACSPPGSSVYGISQARIQSGLPSPSLGDLPDLGIKPKSPALAGGFFTTNATWEALPIFRPSSSISALSGISFSVYSLSFIAFCSSEALLSPCGLTLPEKFSESE